MGEMGCLYICVEVSMMSSFVTMPREGHLQQLLQLFAYLKIHNNSQIVFDPSYLEIDVEGFNKMIGVICMEITHSR